MNQGIPFARTIRSLDADDFRASKLGLFLAAAVLAAWVWWALAARVPQYANSTSVQMDPAGQSASAYLPASAHASIRAGQPAILRTAVSQIDAVVTKAAETGDGQIRVGLRLSQPNSHLAEPLTVEIETDRASPAMIALQAAGFGNR